jgi:hypothetical protein
MTATSEAIAVPKPTARSRVTNSRALLPGVDGRSTWMRRFRDLIGPACLRFVPHGQQTPLKPAWGPWC